ncbi:MAG: ABC transporter permease [Ethanoligenens sp.]
MVTNAEYAKRKAKAAQKAHPTAIRRVILKLLETGALSWLFILVIWQLASLASLPDFLPGPLSVFEGFRYLLANGTLLKFIGVSFLRIIAGWFLGSLIGIPIGILMGRLRPIKVFVDPILNFFRFIPAIGFLTLFMLWFGVGESAKLVLIMYATAFLVVLNTAAGVASVPEEKIRAARSLGASETQTIFHVVIPASISAIFTGERLAMGNSFGAIVGAEMLAANSGVGYLIWTARLYFKTPWIFVGLISLGIMGFLTDRLLVLLAVKVLGRYGTAQSTGNNDGHS